MGLMDKKLSDWTAGDAVDVWVLTGLWDLGRIFILIMTLGLVWFGPRAPRRSPAEVKSAGRAYRKRLRQQMLYRDLGIDD